MVEADVAIIGGSGLYSIFSPGASGHLATITPSTPYGPTSGDIEIAEVGGVRTAFLSRHGPGHRFPAHKIPYRANLHALAELGVKQIIGSCAAGSLRREAVPGSLVVPDQLVDQTHTRVQTFHDDSDGTTVHAQFAEPYCARVRESLLVTCQTGDWAAEDGGAMVVIEGPRFSTRAEAGWYAGAGWTLVNMTGHPEAVLARELRLCYATLALVTDYAANLTTGAGVSEAEVFRLVERNLDRLRLLLPQAVEHLPDPAGCRCHGQ